VRGDRPPDDHPAEHVLHEGHVAEPGPGPHVREIRDPQTVRSLRGEVAIDEVGRPSRFLVAAGGELGPSSPSPLQAALAHEAPHPVTADLGPFPAQLVPEFASAVDPVVGLEHPGDLLVQACVSDGPRGRRTAPRRVVGRR